MTMPKRETNNIWARVRDDIDLDDLIFRHEDGAATESVQIHSDR